MYNGYTNYATWNVCLWCDNEYPIYKEYTDIRRRFGDISPSDANALVTGWFPNGTPDMQTAPRNKYSEVDWQEVADNFNAE